MHSTNSRTKVKSGSFLRIAVSVLIGLLVIAFWQVKRVNLNEYYLYLMEDRKPVSFEFTELSEDWTEQTLHEKFSGYPITCRPYGTNLATDRACGIDVKSHNGVPALFISFFFASDRLQEMAVNVPLWSHATANSIIIATIGRPTSAQLLPHDGVRLVGWQLPNGSGLFLNRDPNLLPPNWNTIYWRSASACAKGGCFMKRQENTYRKHANPKA